ncbi:murein biosynthesis integral membrane protein MurJ [Bifidobacterium choloepi]|uniref:Murein biosynthesis integral membrane protein MurJ n=1 Tax=Bifidobacterium choloepi TaxID=2614131 RepID=A0A6I5NI11_9BIFI|nr:murein biosynthesis integral membrane protein MurJ [Bifidobacterium choloepi]NEG69973.1 hypothetical protein [Bifidobacterium choloepi]
MSSSVGRNSLIMASGTAASRITGQIRTILLAAAIGTTGLAANAYQAGAMIPQVIYTLVSGGVFNAVLVPQIVRTLKARDAEERLNKLITFAIGLLLVVTLLMAALTPVLARLYVNGSDDLIALTSSFTLWCMPQIFFYGLYTVVGQVLAAKNHFATYAWSSVGANVISCAGFGVFIWMFGDATAQGIGFWTQDKILLTAGFWTLGVAFQALVLFLPLMRCGIHYRPKFGVHGIGLRSMGPVAAWSVGIVGVDQVANVLCTRVTTAAPGVANALYGLSEFDVAGNATYQNANTIYVLPYSLIAVSVATAIFPQISASIAERRIDNARADLSQALRIVGIIMCFFTAALIVMPLAVTRALLPSVAVPQAQLIAGVLIMLSIGLPFSSAYLIIQRTFYAFEDGRSPFVFILIENVIQLAIMYAGTALLPPTYWAMVLALSVSLGYIISFVPLVVMLRKRFNNRLDGKRIAFTYGKAIIATILAVLVGLLLQKPIYALCGIHVTSKGGTMGWGQSILACIVFAVVLAAVYFGSLVVMKSEELMQIIAMVKAKLGRGGVPVPAPEAASEAAEPATVSAEPALEPARPVIVTLDEPLNEVEELVPAVPAELEEEPMPPSFAPEDRSKIPPSFAPEHAVGRAVEAAVAAGATTTMANGNMAGVGRHSAPPASVAASSGYIQAEDTMKPHLGDTVLGRYTLVSPLREEPGLQVWKANDRVLSRDCQLFIVNNRSVLVSVNATAGSLAMSHDSRFTPVLRLQHDGEVAIVVTQLDPGVSVTQYLQGPSGAPLSHEAMRSIIAETGHALAKLHRDHITNRAVSTDTIRLTKSGIQLADTPVSAALADTSGAEPTANDERLAVCQLAGVLYCMLTGKASHRQMQYSLAELPSDIPMEFRAICKRGLNLSEPGSPTIPLLTINELEMLLGAAKPLHALSRHDLRLTGVDGNCSIVTAAVKPVNPADLIPIPDTLASSDVLPDLMFNPLPLKGTDVSDDEDEDDDSQDESSDTSKNGEHGDKAGEGAAAEGSFKALWNTSKRYMNGQSDKAAPEVDPADKTEMFTAFTGDEPEPPLQPNRLTMAMDVSLVRNGHRDGTQDAIDGTNSTGRIPIVDAEGNPILPGAESQRALEAEQAEKNAAYDEGLPPALPPSYAPKENPARHALSAKFDDGKKKKSRKGRVIATVIVIVALVAALSVCVHSLITKGSIFGFLEEDDTSYWPSMNLNDVPFGSRLGEDVTSSPSTTSPTATPTTTSPSSTASTTNTTAYTITSQRFLNEPNGQQGYGYYIQLSQPEDVSRVVVQIRSSGGTGYIYVNTTGDPTQGEKVAQFTFDESGTTDIQLDKTVNTQNIVLWVPLDSLPGNQLYILSMKAY